MEKDTQWNIQIKPGYKITWNQFWHPWLQAQHQNI